MSECHTGKKKSEKHKENIRKSKQGVLNPSFGKKWLHNDDKAILVNKDEVQHYIDNGWSLGRHKTK